MLSRKRASVIVCGDFNFPRQSPAYQQMISQSGLIDALSSDPRPTYLPFPLVPVQVADLPGLYFLPAFLRVKPRMSLQTSSRWSTPPPDGPSSAS